MSPILALLIEEAFKYGPALGSAVIKALQKPNVTVAEIEALFAEVKPYEAYQIPNVDGSGKPLTK